MTDGIKKTAVRSSSLFINTKEAKGQQSPDILTDFRRVFQFTLNDSPGEGTGSIKEIGPQAYAVDVEIDPSFLVYFTEKLRRLLYSPPESPYIILYEINFSLPITLSLFRSSS